MVSFFRKQRLKIHKKLVDLQFREWKIGYTVRAVDELANLLGMKKRYLDLPLVVILYLPLRISRGFYDFLQSIFSQKIS